MWSLSTITAYDSHFKYQHQSQSRLHLSTFWHLYHPMMMTMMNSHNALCPELVNQFVARTGFAYLFRYLMCDGREKFFFKNGFGLGDGDGCVSFFFCWRCWCWCWCLCWFWMKEFFWWVLVGMFELLGIFFIFYKDGEKQTRIYGDFFFLCSVIVRVWSCNVEALKLWSFVEAGWRIFWIITVDF